MLHGLVAASAVSLWVRARRNAEGLAYVRPSATGRGPCRRVTSLRPVNVGLCFVRPAERIRIVGEIEQPAQQPNAIISPEPETSCERDKRVREGPGIVVSGPDGVSDEVADCLGIFVTGHQVGSAA